MKTVQTIEDLRAEVRSARAAGKTIGCVPTLGALHDGHISLVEAATQQTDFVVVTIFVNPTQFAPNEDLSKYPKPLEDDLRMCEDAGVDLVFNPDTDTVYPAKDAAFVEIPACSTTLEGARRPGHFRGVTTIVLKLFNMVSPDVAFFGQKDYQQQLLIRHMVDDLNVPVEIRTCPTVREADGLALSSRNTYLSDSDRQTALALSQAVKLAYDACTVDGKSPTECRQTMLDHLARFSDVKLDYAVIADANTLTEVEQAVPEMVALIAAKVGTTWLIDNMLISQSTHP
jgi:pantoate--beta-alanine ligase